MLAPYRIVSEIFEGGNADYPVVTHIFRGKTIREANTYFKAHLSTDSFFRSCIVDRKFRGFTCHERRRNERWAGDRWVSA